MTKRWQKVELTYLQKHAGKKSLEDLAKRFHTDTSTVEAKLRELRPDNGAAAGTASEEDVLKQYEQGMEALYQGQWREAERLLVEVAVQSPQSELAARARQFARAARNSAGADEGEEPYLRAVYDKNRRDFDAALAACEQGGRAREDGRFAYLAAVVECLRGNLEASGTHLESAFSLDPRSRGFARRDPDLETLRHAPEHAHLFEA